MKRFLRIAGAAGAIVIAAVVACAVALRLLLPPERARLLLERQLETQLGRDVTLGALRIGGLSTFRVEGLQVSEASGFQGGTFLSADKVAVSARLLPLLFRRLIIKEIVLKRPTATIVRRADGKLNVLAPPMGQADSGSRSRAAAGIFVSDLRLEGGSVSFVDHSTASLSALLEPVDVRLSHVGLTAPIAMTGVAGAAFRGIRAGLDFNAIFDPVRGDLALTRFSVTAGTASLNILGRLSGAAEPAPVFSGTILWTNLDPSSFTAVAALPEGLAVNGPTSGRLVLAGQGPEPKARLEIDLTPAEVRWKTLAQKRAGVPLTAALTVDRDASGNVGVRDFFVRLASIEVRGDGNVRGARDAAHVAAFRIETNDFEITDLFRNVSASLPRTLSLSGPVRVVASMDGWSGGGRFVADVDGTRASAAYGGAFQKAPGVLLRLIADGRYATPLAVDFSSVRLDLGALSLNGRGSYSPGKIRPTYTFRVRTNAFPLAAAGDLMPAAVAYRPTGQAVVNMRISRGPEGPLISGAATLLSSGGTVGEAPVSDLTGTVEFSNEEVSSSRLTGRLSGAPLQVDLRAENLGSRPSVTADVRASRLDLDRLFPSQAKAGFPFRFDTRGSLRAADVVHATFKGKDLAIDWDLTSVSRGLPEASGKARLRLGAGEARNARALLDMPAAVRLAAAPIVLLQRLGTATGGALTMPALDNLAFTSVRGEYAFRRGAAAVVPYAVEAASVSVRFEGTVDLAGDRGVGLTASVAARASEWSGALGRALVVLGDRPVVRLAIGGTLESPVITIDRATFGRRLREVMRKVGDGAESLLKELLGPGASPGN